MKIFIKNYLDTLEAHKMKDIEYFYDLLEKSDVTILGYNTRQERIKDRLISKLSHLQLTEIDSEFSIKPFLRNLKLDVLLEEGESVTIPEYLVIDLNNVKSNQFNNSSNVLIRQREIANIINDIRVDMYSIAPYTINARTKASYKLILISQLNTSVTAHDSIINIFSCGVTPIAMSDLAIVMSDKSMKIIKNRFDANDIEVSYDDIKKDII